MNNILVHTIKRAKDGSLSLSRTPLMFVGEYADKMKKLIDAGLIMHSNSLSDGSGVNFTIEDINEKVYATSRTMSWEEMIAAVNDAKDLLEPLMNGIIMEAVITEHADD